MSDSLVALIAHEKEVRERIAKHDAEAVAERKRLIAAHEAVRHQIGNAKAGLDNDRIANALSILKVYGSYTNGGQDKASVVRDAVDWLATGKCAAYRGLDQLNFGTKSYDRWYGQRSDHEWGGPAHGSIIFQIGLKDRKTELTEEQRSDAIYFLLNIEAWEQARAKAREAA
jgi:hypothetical protein